MKWTIIGYWGAYPEQGGATSAYLLEKGGFTCLIDCGSGAVSKIPAYKNIMDLNAVILSHYHNDHIADVGVLQYSWLVQNSIQQTDHVLPIYGHLRDREAFEKLSHQYTKGIAYEPDQPLEIGPFQFRFLETVHPAPCYGMRISEGEKVIVYTADTSYKEDWVAFSEGADLLITDCNFYEGQDASKAGHMNSRQGAEIAAKAGVKELVLSHLPHHGEITKLPEEARAYFKGPVHLAHEGFVWAK
ncbi:MBL fold metallo-hydrolase [Sediminibacillus massiliensis]|uniref:MBL fold metallo-hydrolase n=1 Tax=Sediminibacillus massiliensis TaxID=1926277 RepID=UPI000988518E|nr:MBL fold metallo-hydrolase [Sediminibacillus massiliensis]